jgi:hypothetical protein
MVDEDVLRKTADKALREIMMKLDPAVLAILADSYSGEIRLRFQCGKFKEAVRTEVRL